MQFEARQAHFIKDCKTLSGTRVFMCNQMQQLAWLQLLLGLLRTSTWLNFSSIANSGGAFSLTTWTGLREIVCLILSAGTWRRERWDRQMSLQGLTPLMKQVGKMDEFPASLLAQFNNGKCFLIFFLQFPSTRHHSPLTQGSTDCCVVALLSHVFFGEGDEYWQKMEGPFSWLFPFVWMGSR